MATITIEVPDDILTGFDDMDEVRRTIYEDFVIEQRQMGKVSLGRAAELLEITYTEFFDLLGKKELSFINASDQELEQSYQKLEKTWERMTR